MSITTFERDPGGLRRALFDVVGEPLPPGKVHPADIDAALTDFLHAAGTAQGLVIFVALMWELTVSGATVTNGDNHVSRAMRAC